MPYKLSGREVVTIVLAIYEKYPHVADALHDASSHFPIEILDHWRRAGAVSREVTSEFFAYCDQKGEEQTFNTFIFGRLHSAITRGGNTFEDFFEAAVHGPLLEQDTSAMRVAEMNTKSYLMALGGNDLACDHFPILQMLLAYHQGTLHPLALQTGELDTKKYVTTYQGLASEFYHRIGKGHDWQAIAHFMVNDTKYQGVGMDLLAKYGNAEVYRVPLATACDSCKMLYMENNKPKIYRINDLLHNCAATISQRAEESATAPVCGPSHLWCECSRPSVLTGMEWWLEKEVKVLPPEPETIVESVAIPTTPKPEGFMSRASKFLSQFCEK